MVDPGSRQRILKLASQAFGGVPSRHIELNTRSFRAGFKASAYYANGDSNEHSEHVEGRGRTLHEAIQALESTLHQLARDRRSWKKSFKIIQQTPKVRKAIRSLRRSRVGLN